MFRINDNGNVGIGTTTPGAKLDVTSADVVTAKIVSTSTDPNGVLTISEPTVNANCNTCSELVYFLKDGTIMGSIVANLSANSVAYNTTSDVRLKTNIKPTHYGLDDLMKIGVKDYNRIGDKDSTIEIGFIAQELYKVFPQIVNVGGESAKTDPWQVEYGRITPLLVKSIQEQQKTIVELKIKTDELEKMKSELNSLKQTTVSKDEFEKLKAYMSKLSNQLEAMDKQNEIGQLKAQGGE